MGDGLNEDFGVGTFITLGVDILVPNWSTEELTCDDDAGESLLMLMLVAFFIFTVAGEIDLELTNSLGFKIFRVIVTGGKVVQGFRGSAPGTSFLFKFGFSGTFFTLGLRGSKVVGLIDTAVLLNDEPSNLFFCVGLVECKIITSGSLRSALDFCWLSILFLLSLELEESSEDEEDVSELELEEEEICRARFLVESLVANVKLSVLGNLGFSFAPVADFG